MLERVDGPPLLEDETELLDIIRCKILGLRVSQESSTGMPMSQLSALSLGGLLSLIRTLAKFHLQLKTLKQLDDPQSVVTAAAHVLRSFPANFHKLLWTIGEQNVPKRCAGGVRSQFSHIYTCIFKYTAEDPPETRDFLASAFLDFAVNQWGGRGFVEPKLLHRLQKSIPKRFVTRAEFGARYGFAPSTVARVLATKSIRTITIRAGKRNRTLIDLQQLHEPPVEPGKVLGLRTAAAAIGVTAKALRRLRASGHFEVKCVVRHDGYHEHDINQFIERLLALNPDSMTKTLPRDCITFHQAIHRYRTGGVSASIIRALLSGELRVLGNVDGTVRGLFVSVADLQQFGKDDRARQSGNTRTSLEVAKEIHCKQECVPGLVEVRLLDGWKTPTGLRISEQSIARFKKNYVSLVSIACEIGSVPTALVGHCAAKHIPLVFVKYPHRQTKQAFVRIKDRNAVLSFRSARWWDQERSAERKRRVTANERLKVLRAVKQGHITKKQAAVELGFSVTWVRQLLVRWRVGGDSALRPWVRRQTASRGTIPEEKAGQAAKGTASTSADRSALNEDFHAAGQSQAA